MFFSPNLMASNRETITTGIMFFSSRGLKQVEVSKSFIGIGPSKWRNGHSFWCSFPLKRRTQVELLLLACFGVGPALMIHYET